MTSPRQEQHNAKKVEWMEKCFECYAENGLTGTGMKALAKACGCTPGNLYLYFDNLDAIITPLIFTFVRACVHYAMFEDEYYLKTQMEVLKQGVALFADKYRSQYLNGGNEK